MIVQQRLVEFSHRKTNVFLRIEKLDFYYQFRSYISHIHTCQGIMQTCILFIIYLFNHMRIYNILYISSLALILNKKHKYQRKIRSKNERVTWRIKKQNFSLKVYQNLQRSLKNVSIIRGKRSWNISFNGNQILCEKSYSLTFIFKACRTRSRPGTTLPLLLIPIARQKF